MMNSLCGIWSGWVEIGTVLFWAVIYWFLMWFLGIRKQPTVQPSMYCG